MNGGSLNLVISSPCVRPSIIASTSISADAAGHGMFWVAMKSTNSAPISAITEPTDSSMPPVRMTMDCPSADNPNMPTRLAVLAILIGNMKRGLIIVTTAPDRQNEDQQAQIFLGHSMFPMGAARRRAVPGCISIMVPFSR